MENKKEPSWPAIRDLFSQLIIRSNWENAEIIATPDEMMEHFNNAYPGVFHAYENIDLALHDMQLALHDLNIPFERNENNNIFYYLANWR